MHSVETRSSSGNIFIAISIILFVFAVAMSFTVSEFVAPTTPMEKFHVGTMLPLVITLVAVLLLISIGILYSVQQVTTLY